MRPVDEVLARARALSLLSIVEDAMYLELIPGLVAELGLEPWLTDDERAWFAEDRELDAVDGYQAEAMLVMAWAIGLVPALGDRHPDAYGPVLDLLQNLEPVRPEAIAAPRPDAELIAMQAELDALHQRGEAPPPDERFGREALHYRRAALRWLLEPRLAWAPGRPAGA